MSQARDSLAALDVPMERFADALAAARPSRRGSMVTLRASADGASSAVRRVVGELRELEDTATGDDRRELDGLIDGLGDVRSLLDSLTPARISLARMEVANARAEQAVEDAGLDFPDISARPLVSALRIRFRPARKPAPAAVDSAGVSRPVGSTSGSTTVPSSAAPDYFTYYGPAFQARLPRGSSWGTPAQSEPTPGRLYRTSVRGPGGLFVIVDYTPFEAATFGGRYQSREEVGQTAFGAATRYVFQGGSLPECQRATCVDYIINDRSSGRGFAVLAGGLTYTAAADLARTVAESVVPGAEGE